MPKDRRVPQMPNATPTWVVNELLTLTVTEPTIGCRQYADRLTDTATRWAIIMIVLGVPNGTVSARFVQHVISRYRRLGVTMRCVLSGNGPEYIARTFTDALAAKELTHQRIPPRSPNYNAVCERFQGSALQECWRPAFHRRRFTSIRQLQAEIDSWLVHYNNRRRNHGDLMRGRTPRVVLDSHRDARSSVVRSAHRRGRAPAGE